MPSREEMVAFLQSKQAAASPAADASAQPSGPAPSRADMIEFIKNKQNPPPDPTTISPGESRSDFFSRMASPDMQAKMKQATIDATQKQSDVSETGRNAIGNALTLNYLPQIKAKTAQVLSGDGVGNNENYLKRRDDEIAREQELAKAYPAAHATNTAIGMALPIVASMGGLASVEAPAAIANLGAQGFKAAAGRIAVQGAKGAATGAAFGFGGNPGDQKGVVDPVQLDDRLEAAKTGAKWGAALGAGPTAIAEGLPAAISGGKWLGKKAVSIFLGPSGEAIDKYIANPSAIKNAPSIESIKDGIDESMQHLFNGVDQAKINTSDAKDALTHVERQVREVTGDAGFKFRIQSADIKEQLAHAQSQLDNAFESQKNKLASTASPIELAPHVEDSIQQLKDKVVKGSNESYGILDQDPNHYDVRGIGDQLHKVADDMNVKGQKVVETETPNTLGSLGGGPQKTKSLVETSSAPVAGSAVQSEIKRLADKISNLPEQLPAPELKKIIQDLDNSGKAMYGQPGFDSRTSQAFKAARAKLDQIIKGSNKAYEAKMAEIAPNADLLNQSLERFGDPRAAAAKLNGITGPTASADRELLSNLGRATGKDFETPVSEYAGAQSKLKNPQVMSDLKDSLPESKPVSKIQSVKEQMARPETQPAFVEKTLSDSGLPDKHAAAQKAFEDAQAKLEKAKADLEPFQSLTPRNSQNAVKGLMKSPGVESIDLRRKMEALDQTTDNTFTKDIEARRIAQQFEKGNTNGSRNAVVFGSAGGAIGHMVGGNMGAGVGLALGAQVGSTVDKYGPQIAMKVLDAGLSAKNVTTALLKIPEMAELAKSNPAAFRTVSMGINSKLASGQLPLTAKASQKNELDSDSSVSAQYKVPTKGPDKWTADGLSKLSQHDPSMQIDQSALSDPKLKDLVIQASDLKPGSKAMDAVQAKIKSQLSKGKN